MDLEDLRILASNINTRPPGDERADVDGNGVVDIGDLTFVARYFGLGVTPPTATSPRPTATSPRPTATTPPTPAPKSVDVQATDAERFVAQDITVRRGDTVRWTNVGAIPHNDVLLSGGTHQVTFTDLGAFSYVCNFHPPGMVGSVRVVP